MSAPLTAPAVPGVVPPGDEVLPGYRVVSLLAHGARVDTYDVLDLERDCRAVAKVARPDRAHEARIREALATEGRLLTTLSHPHLVRGYGALDDGVVMETVPGATLAALLDDGPLGVLDTALLARQLVSVLGYLHRRGWLHLDVKPENLVVQEGRVVLIDLGLATPPGLVERGMGTVGYAAPEQDGGHRVGPAADVWGLGATLHEALVGSAPGRSPSLGLLPAPLRPLVRDCLAPDPAERPTTEEVAARLDALLDPPTPLSLRERWTTRRPGRRR